jgi:hypothetical protein
MKTIMINYLKFIYLDSKIFNTNLYLNIYIKNTIMIQMIKIKMKKMILSLNNN